MKAILLVKVHSVFRSFEVTFFQNKKEEAKSKSRSDLRQAKTGLKVRVARRRYLPYPVLTRKFKWPTNEITHTHKETEL